MEELLSEEILMSVEEGDQMEELLRSSEAVLLPEEEGEELLRSSEAVLLPEEEGDQMEELLRSSETVLRRKREVDDPTFWPDHKIPFVFEEPFRKFR